MIRYHIIFAGRVQGVGFRSFVTRIATDYGCSGFVKNLLNGCVDVEIQGDKNKIDFVLKLILQGNTFIRIDDYSIQELPVIKEVGFKYLY